jgi:hypothetical protein
MPCEPHLHHSNLRAMDYPLCGRVRSWLYKKIMKTIALILRLFKKQRETSQPLVAIKPKP